MILRSNEFKLDSITSCQTLYKILRVVHRALVEERTKQCHDLQRLCVYSLMY